MQRGELVALALAPSGGAGLACQGRGWSIEPRDCPGELRRLEFEVRPRWVWWNQQTPAQLFARGLAVATCWDLNAVHNLLFGGWRTEPGPIYASSHGLDQNSAPRIGQLDLLGAPDCDDGNPEEPVRADGHLRPEWTSGGWLRSPRRLIRWAELALAVATRQAVLLSELAVGGDPLSTARSESAAELLCTELAQTGLPLDRGAMEQLIAEAVGPRPRDEDDARAIRRGRDAAVLAQISGGSAVDLRNPAQVRDLLERVGIALPDTRAWRLEAFRGAHPVVEQLLRWRKAERIATTYGYQWLERHVGPDDRLRGEWNGSDGAAGRMTATAGLHNLPTELRRAVAPGACRRFVRADLGQIEPRVLAAVSGDPALARATADDDLYAPVAARLGVERSVAKVAVLAAMYGQTSGTAGEALKGLERAYPVAMRYLNNAYEHGRAGRDVRTYGGRLVRMWGDPEIEKITEPVADIGGGPPAEDTDFSAYRSRAAARGRYARNAVIQGAAAELFKAWAVTVRARIGQLDAPDPAYLVLCLHDELVVSAAETDAEAIAALVRDCLAEAAHRWAPPTPRVRFVAEVSIIERWSDAKA